VISAPAVPIGTTVFTSGSVSSFSLMRGNSVIAEQRHLVFALAGIDLNVARHRADDRSAQRAVDRVEHRAAHHHQHRAGEDDAADDQVDRAGDQIAKRDLREDGDALHDGSP
jgi:hypothetical protein